MGSPNTFHLISATFDCSMSSGHETSPRCSTGMDECECPELDYGAFGGFEYTLRRTGYVLECFTIHDNRPKRKSLTMGELENSGLRRTQLETIVR